MTHYDVLGVPPGAPHAEVRRAFLAVARRVHPDVHANADVGTRRRAEAQMQAVNDAWAVLGDAGRRSAYDVELRRAARLAAERDSFRTGDWTGARTASPSGPGRANGTGSGGWTYAAEPVPPRPADWRRHAGPGAGIGRSGWARAVAVLPVGLLLGAALLLGAGQVLRVPELTSLAAAVALMALLAFLAAPILAMKEARRAQRRPSRSAPRRSAASSTPRHRQRGVRSS